MAHSASEWIAQRKEGAERAKSAKKLAAEARKLIVVSRQAVDKSEALLKDLYEVHWMFGER